MKKHLPFLALFVLGLLVSAIRPHDYFTWFLEVFPAIAGLIILAATYRRFRFTRLSYGLILIHCYILFIGGHYTYAEVPLFDHIRDLFHQSRNNYDKVGHFTQGFVPAIITRELLIRKQVIRQHGWLNVLTVCTCVTISAFYEFLEWAVALVTGASADAFLGTQGYAWDTQSDMLYATIGAISALLLLSRIHNRQISRVSGGL